MYELIPLSQQIFDGETYTTCDARDLHAALQVKKDYSDWIKTQIKRARLVENRDYSVFPQQGELDNAGAQGRIDYAVTIDAAKHIAMLSHTTKGFEVREYFLLCERMAKASHQQAVPALSFHYLRDHRAFLEDLGLFEDRDRLLLADIARTQLQRQAGLLPAGTPALTPPQGFDVEEALRHVAPSLAASQLRKLTSEAGKRVAKEYRLRFNGADPETTSRYVDGKIRPVKWYAQEASEWVYPILQSYLAQLGLLPTT